MNREQIFDAIGKIPDDWIAGAHAPSRRRARRYKFPAIAAAILLCLALAVPALAAADVAPAYELLYRLSPSLAQQLKPVRKTCVDNGIALEVISAAVEGDTARVYLGLTDQTGDRVDGTCDLFDSYDIHLAADSAGSCTFVSYDASAKTATFLVEVSRMDGLPIRGNKLTFSMGCFLSGKREYAGALEIDPAAAAASPATQTDILSRGYNWNDDAYARFSLDKYLVPAALLSPMEGVTLTGMGWVDGRLHIQTHYADIFETDANGYVYLVDARGEAIPSACEEDFWDEDHSGVYLEQVFDVDPDALAGCRLFGQFCASDTCTEGNWEITFPLT